MQPDFTHPHQRRNHHDICLVSPACHQGEANDLSLFGGVSGRDIRWSTCGSQDERVCGPQTVTVVEREGRCGKRCWRWRRKTPSPRSWMVAWSSESIWLKPSSESVCVKWSRHVICTSISLSQVSRILRGYFEHLVKCNLKVAWRTPCADLQGDFANIDVDCFCH